MDPTAIIASESMKRGDVPFDSSSWSRRFNFDYCFNSVDPNDTDYANQNTVCALAFFLSFTHSTHTLLYLFFKVYV